MDIYIEQIVSKVPSTKDTMRKVGLGVLTLLVTMILFLLSGLFNITFIGLILACGCIYGGYYLISSMNVEYEYIITNGEMDIDKIIAKRKRKRLITAKVSSFEKFGPVNGADQSGNFTTILASSGDSEEDYYADLRHSAYGQVRIIFSPNEKVLEAIKPFIPRTIQ